MSVSLPVSSPRTLVGLWGFSESCVLCAALRTLRRLRLGRVVLAVVGVVVEVLTRGDPGHRGRIDVGVVGPRRRAALVIGVGGALDPAVDIDAVLGDVGDPRLDPLTVDVGAGLGLLVLPAEQVDRVTRRVRARVGIPGVGVAHRGVRHLLLVGLPGQLDHPLLGVIDDRGRPTGLQGRVGDLTGIDDPAQHRAVGVAIRGRRAHILIIRGRGAPDRGVIDEESSEEVSTAPRGPWA